MPAFQYVALDASGIRQRGAIEASDQMDAARLLDGRGLRVITLQALIAPRIRRLRASTKETPDAIALLINELATLLEAGVPLAEAIATLAEAQHEEHFLKVVLRSLRGGSSFSAALAESGLRLPEYVLQLVRAGESTGRLAASLRAASQHLDAELQFAQDAKNALLYPTVLIGSGIIATLVMFVFVVPRFAAVLDNPKADLPWISQLVLGAGLWLTQHQAIVAAALLLIAFLIAWAWGRDDVRQAAWEMAARMPVLGSWAQHAELGRWASLLAVLLNSKVPLLSALAQANETLRRRSLRSRSMQALSEVRGGKAMSQALADNALLDAAGVNLIKVGERAGSLGYTVASLARMHTNQSQLRLKRFLVLLEPIAILCISIMLGGIMISVMLAITSLTNVL